MFMTREQRLDHALDEWERGLRRRREDRRARRWHNAMARTASMQRHPSAGAR